MSGDDQKRWGGPAGAGTRPTTFSKRTIARLITALEDGRTGELAEVRRRYWTDDGAVVVGVTGPAGAGKSTLIDALITELRARGLSVAVLAVDPTSRVTGGALLGDRVRMTRHLPDPHVFVRSLATRGHVGGLSGIVPEAVRILDVAGYDVVLVETIGVGQDEIEVADCVHTVMLVTAPGLGDEIQDVKAGLMEIADVVVLNKADTLPSWKGEGAAVEASAGAHGEGESAAHGGGEGGGADDGAANGDTTRRTVIRTSATTGKGVAELVVAVLAHQERLRQDDRLAGLKAAQVPRVLDRIVEQALHERLMARVKTSARYGAVCARVQNGEIDLQTAAEELLETAVAERRGE